MFSKISSLVLAILLFLVLLGSTSNLYVFGVSLGVLIIATFIVNLRRLGWNMSYLLFPVFFLIGVGGMFSIITSPTLRLIFLIVSCILFLMVELQLGKESHFLQNIYLLSAFAIFISIFALQFYFSLGIYLLALLVFVFSYLMIVQGFAGITLPVKKYFSFVIALSCGELALGLVLWPTYFLVNAIVLFCMFYLMWLFSISIFFGKLSVKKIYWQLALVSIVLIVTLTSASWRPLIA